MSCFIYTICTKCKIRYIEENFAPLCYICGLKSKGFYRAAIKALTNPYTGEIGGWWGFHTNWDFKAGWSILENMLWTAIFIGILKCGSLNKTPKTNEKLTDFYPEYWVKRLMGKKWLKRHNKEFDV